MALVPQIAGLLVVAVTGIAALQDVRSSRISNVLPVVVVVLFALTAITGAWSPAQAGLAIGLALAAFLIGAVLFRYGLLGGGDVKLVAAVVLWVHPSAVLTYIAWIAMAGGGVALFMLLGRLLPEKTMESHPIASLWFTKEKEKRQNMPYGLAIMVGTLILWYQGGLGPTP